MNYNKKRLSNDGDMFEGTLDRYREIDRRKKKRPACHDSEDGSHTMVTYRSTNTKECEGCGYTEEIYGDT